MRSRTVLAAIAACLLLPASASASCGSIRDRLTPEKESIEVTCLPEGTQHIDIAIMRDRAGEGLEYLSIPATQTVYTPPADLPVVDAQAWTSTRAIGGWAPRRRTVPGGVEEKKEPPKEERKEPPKEEELPREPGAFLPGLNAGYWGSPELSDLKALGTKVVRLATPSETTEWEAAGLKVIADMEGPYDSTGVSGVDVASYVARDVALVRKDPHLFALETLNEPGGSWFWGSSSESAANREAYARLVIAVHEALVKEFGAARPLQICSFDGGHDSSDAWGEAWSRVPGALAACDAVTNHPYGGTGNRSTAILGDRALVERTHALSGEPVWVTEVGFPTKGPTGDSLQYTEAEQAWAMYHFFEWAAATGYVPVVTEYGYRDSGEGGGYGVETHAGAHKLSFTAVQEFDAGLSCAVCG